MKKSDKNIRLEYTANNFRCIDKKKIEEMSKTYIEGGNRQKVGVKLVTLRLMKSV